MKTRALSRILCVVAAFLVAWSASGKSVVQPEDPPAPAGHLEVAATPEPAPLPELGEASSSVCGQAESGAPRGVISFFEVLDQLKGGEQEMAFECPGIFYQPTTCGGCINPYNQCIQEQLLSPPLCGLCMEVCQCNRGCCW